MTTPGPESDPYFDVQPAVPGWSAGQDFYTGPLYDDTGWHIDVSNVDWGPRGSAEPPADPAAAPATKFRYDRNVVAPPPVRSTEPPATRSERPAGRHARHARPGDVRPERPASPSVRGRRAAGPGYPDAPASRPAARQDYPDAPASRRPAAGLNYPDAAAVRSPARLDYPPPGRGRAVDGGYPEAELRRAAPPPPEPGSASVARSSGVMAVGTLGSRLTGFLRQILQNAALGAAALGTAYNLSNTLPNVVYNLALGGILTSVIVPLIVSAAKRDRSRSEAFDQRMFTLITAALAGITVLAMILAVPIVHLYSGSAVTRSPATFHLAVIFALFFIPQIFFYGLSSLMGAILNSRGSFAAPMWTPIVNNFVVMAVLGLFLAVAGLHQTPATISGFDTVLLGFGTTLGIIAQTVALMPALRRVGFRWRARLDFRRDEIAEIGRMGGWMFGYIAATQVAFLITTKIAGDTSTGIPTYNNAWLLFQLPYAVVGISVITALLPRMSAHASERRFGMVRQDFSTGVRLASTIVVPCSLVLAVLGPDLGTLFFAHGSTKPAQAHYMGVVFAVFCLGLLPYMIFQLQLRVFYSMRDSKTPALIGAVTMTVNIVANLIALHYFRANLVAGLAVGFGLANVAGLLLAWRILSVRLRGLDGWLIGRSLVRMHAATIPAALLAILVAMLTGNAVVVAVVGGGLAAGMYLIFARVLRIEELNNLIRSLSARVGR